MTHGRRFRRALLACALLLTVPAAPAPAAPKQDARFADALVRQVNAARRAAGVRPLRTDRRLNRAAGHHALDLAGAGRLDHASSDGTPMSVRVRRWLRAARVGETVAFLPLSQSAPQAALGVFFQSPAHRATLLSPVYARIGIGRRPALFGTPGTVVTVDLASRR
jgi:uncharacterized protein YkwD